MAFYFLSSKIKIALKYKLKKFKQNLYFMDPTKKFGGISVFLWNMPFLEYDKVMIKIKELLLRMRSKWFARLV